MKRKLRERVRGWKWDTKLMLPVKDHLFCCGSTTTTKNHFQNSLNIYSFKLFSKYRLSQSNNTIAMGVKTRNFAKCRLAISFEWFKIINDLSAVYLKNPLTCLTAWLCYSTNFRISILISSILLCCLKMICLVIWKLFPVGTVSLTYFMLFRLVDVSCFFVVAHSSKRKYKSVMHDIYCSLGDNSQGNVWASDSSLHCHQSYGHMWRLSSPRSAQTDMVD